MSETSTIENRPHQPTRRRLMLKASLSTLAAIGAAGATAVVNFPALAEDAQSAAQQQKITDVAILNFALNLEYLEAEYYLRAVTGRGLAPRDTTGTGRHGRVIGGSRVPFMTSTVRQFAEEIAGDELAHVEFLRAKLGKAAIAEPEIDLRNSFNILAQAAGLGHSFDPFASETNFLIGAYVFEDVGVTAYHGAAPLIEHAAILDWAAGILAVEAYHAGTIRTVMYERGLVVPAARISALRRKLGDSVDQGIVIKSHANIVPSDRDGIAGKRTPDEVLNIVYAGGAQNDFGFFPHKVNGTIQ